MVVLTVLDFEDGRVYQYEIDTDNENLQAEDFEIIIADQGHNLEDCEWMSHSDPQVFTETIEL
jgi:hypothetical protein